MSQRESEGVKRNLKWSKRVKKSQKVLEDVSRNQMELTGVICSQRY